MQNESYRVSQQYNVGAGAERELTRGANEVVQSKAKRE